MTTIASNELSPPPFLHDAAIVISGLTKTFTTARSAMAALSSIDLTIRRGEFLCVVGPSGCGKTTLLNILGGLEDVTSGTVTANFEPNGQPHRSIVFQEHGIFPWMTVLENTAFGLRARGIDTPTRRRVAADVLAQVGLAGFENAYPRELSGGMRQRVNLARAFANNPQMLLMDEPFASLDEQTKLIIQDDLLQIWESNRKTVLFITHSVDEAIRLSDRIIVMTARPGRIKEQIEVNLPRPRQVFDLQNNPDFIRIREQVWTALKQEVLALRAKSGGSK